MIKSLLKNSLIALTFSTVTLFADTTEVVWDATAQPGQLEAAITAGGAGTSATGQFVSELTIK